MEFEALVTSLAVSPWRATIDVVFVAAGEDDASSRYDEMIDALMRAGVFPQGGAARLMDASDVVRGSPLDRALRRNGDRA